MTLPKMRDWSTNLFRDDKTGSPTDQASARSSFDVPSNADLAAAALGSLNPALYQGQISTLSASISVAGVAGRWYFSTIAGTLTGTNVTGKVVQVNGYLIDTGSTWLPRDAVSVPSVADIADVKALQFRYVDSVAGSDSADGSFATPYATFARAMVDGVRNFRLKRGSIFRETVDITTLAAPKVEAYGGGNRPIINASDLITSGWVNYSGNVWKIDVPMEAGSIGRAYAGVWENDIKLVEYVIADGGGTLAGTVALLQANPGSFYSTAAFLTGWAAGTYTMYICATGSGNPNSNGNVYEYSRRNSAIIHSGAFLTSIQAEKATNHDGMFRMAGTGVGGLLTDCVAREFGRHGILDPYSTQVNCTVYGGNQKFPGYYFHAYKNTLDQYSASYYNCKAIGTFVATEGTGFGSHSGDTITDSHNTLYYENCEARGLAQGSSIGNVKYIHMVRCRSLWCNSDFGSLSSVKSLLEDCVSIGASGTGFNLPKAGTTLFLRRCKIATALTADTGGMFFGTTSTGVVDIANCEIVNVGDKHANALGVFRASTGTLSLKIRNTSIMLYGGTLPYFTYTVSAPTLDIPAGELIVGGQSSTTYLTDVNVRINGVVSSLSLQSGIGEYLMLDPRRFYRQCPLIDQSFLKKEGVSWPITLGWNSVNFVAGATSFADVLYYGATSVYDQPNDVFESSLVFTPAQEILGSVTGSIAVKVHLGVGRAGYMIRSATPYTSWSVVGAALTANDLYAGAFNGSTNYVVVGSAGTILRSTDGAATWALASSVPGSANLKGATFGASTYVAVGDGGVIYYSADGDTWSLATGTGSGNFRAVAFGGSTFVAVGALGIVYTSTNGSAWTVRTSTSGTIKNFVAIAFAQSKWIAVVDGNNFQPSDAYSTADGITWTPLNLELTFAPRSIAFVAGAHPNRWIICGRSSSVFSSYDGIMWAVQQVAAPNLTRLRDYQYGTLVP